MLSLQQLRQVFSHSYDVVTDVPLGQFTVPLCAHHHRCDTRYMLTKNVPIWTVENNQHFFIYEQKSLCPNTFTQFQTALDQHIQTKHPSSDAHMSSIYIGLIMTATSVPDILQKHVQKSRKLTFLKWGLHGWQERYLAIFSYADHTLYMHRKGKSFIAPLIEHISH